MNRLQRSMAILATLLVVSLSGTSFADVVTDWNEVMLDAVRATNTNPPRATRAFAMMHGAMFDAINAFDREYTPYLFDSPAPRAAAPELAAAAAAHTVLRSLFPTQRPAFDQALASSVALNLRGVGRGRIASSLAWGRQVGRRMVQSRVADGSDTVVAYTPAGEIGAWQPTPPAFAPPLLPQWASVTPFAMTEPAQFLLGPPPALDSEAFTLAYNEVKDLGGMNSVLRTPDETLIAYFWEDGAGTATPPGHWLAIARQLSDEFGLSLIENARLFALLSITQADAAICSWTHKYHYNHFRPYTSIVELADDDGNPDTVADPTWSNLIPTPPFPAYTSGHSTFSGSSAKMLELFLGSDAIPFSAPSPDPQRWPNVLPGVVRSWSTLSEAAEEAGQSRIYGGIHWQYDNEIGLESGRQLATYVFETYLTPLD